jgi:hypothetical protein
MNKIKIEEWKKLDKQGYLYIIIFFRYYLAGFFLCILGSIIVLIILNIININSPLCENIYRFIIFSILAIIIPSVIQKKYIMERLKKRYIIFGSFVGGITFYECTVQLLIFLYKKKYFGQRYLYYSVLPWV